MPSPNAYMLKVSSARSSNGLAEQTARKGADTRARKVKRIMLKVSGLKGHRLREMDMRSVTRKWTDIKIKSAGEGREEATIFSSSSTRVIWVKLEH